VAEASGMKSEKVDDVTRMTCRNKLGELGQETDEQTSLAKKELIKDILRARL
jgi:hypothetical protein